MSTLNPVATATRRAVNIPATGMELVTIRWSLSRAALRAANHERRCDPLLSGIAEQGPDLELRWRVSLGDTSAEALLFDPVTAAEHALLKGALRHTRDGDLLHIEVRDGSETPLAATVRTSGTESRVIYAKTTILALLGLRGGRYEVI